MDTVLFDLDGTLLTMDTDKFMDLYVKNLTNAFLPHMDPTDFMKRLWEATGKMLENNGQGISNEMVFYQSFFHGLEAEKDFLIQVFDTFYQTGFDRAKEATAENPFMVKAVDTLKNKGYRLAVATNPLFPRKAVERRLHWAGLNPEDFHLLTTFENMSACKPTPSYYQQVLAILGIEAHKALMVGNDAREDLAAAELGVGTYLVTDCLLQQERQQVVPDHQGSSADFLRFVSGLPALSSAV